MSSFAKQHARLYSGKVRDGVIGQSYMLSFTMVLYLDVLASVQPRQAQIPIFVFVMPWIVVTLCFAVASVSTPASEDDAKAGGIVAFMLVITVLVLLLPLCLKVAAAYLNPMVAFAFVLCHHKGGCGAMLRFLQYKSPDFSSVQQP